MALTVAPPPPQLAHYEVVRPLWWQGAPQPAGTVLQIDNRTLADELCSAGRLRRVDSPVAQGAAAPAIPEPAAAPAAEPAADPPRRAARAPRSGAAA